MKKRCRLNMSQNMFKMNNILEKEAISPMLVCSFYKKHYRQGIHLGYQKFHPVAFSLILVDSLQTIFGASLAVQNLF